MTRLTAAAIVLSAAALTRAQAPGQAPTAQAATVSGQVVADERGDPIPNARVTLTPAEPGTPVVLTGDEGRFRLIVPPTARGVTVSKSGYTRREITLSTGPAVDIRLSRGAVISGRIVDAFGDPVQGFHVVAEAVSRVATNPAVTATDTDDRGEYRLAGLPPGAVVVAVLDVRGAINVGPSGRPGAVQKTYYPGVVNTSNAEGLGLQAGDERAGIDFVVAADQPTLPPVQMMRLAQNPDQNALARGTATIRGRVIASDGRPVSHALLRLFPQNDPFQTRGLIADNDGHFEFGELPSGTFQLSAQKRGYASVSAGETTPAGPLPASARSVDLASGEMRDRIDLGLGRGGTLSGRVFDERGDVVEGATVQTLQVRYEAGRRHLVPAGAPRTTDDLGRYRLYGLAPGQYVVSATVGAVGSADLPGYVRSYFPHTPTPAEAQFVSVERSRDVVGIDLSLSRTRTARVSGTMLNAAGEPTSGGSLTLRPSLRSGAVTSVPVGARILADGRFEFPNVPDGQYIIRADRGRINGSTEGAFGVLPVSVAGADVTNLALRTSPGSSITGHVRFEAYRDSKTPNPSTVELSPIPVDVDASPSNPASANIHSDWTFEIAGVTGPRRLQLVRAPSGWALSAILINGIDIADRPLPFGRTDQSLGNVEVVLTDRVNEVTGRITDDDTRPVPGSVVVVFAADRDRWYPASRFLRIVVARADGTFSVTGLPFGSYYAAPVRAVPGDGEEAWQDPQFLTPLIPRASAFTLGDTQRLLLNLNIPTPGH